MPNCIVCGKPALYLDLRLKGMACTTHASAEAQVATVRSLMAALLKALRSENVIDRERHTETAHILEQLRPFLKD